MSIISFIQKKLFHLNMLLRHRDKFEHKVVQQGGLFPDKQFFIVNFEDRGTGLFGLVDISMGACEYAEKKGMIPLIDFRGGLTQYHGTEKNDNAWEFFFDQPSQYALSDIDKAKNRVFMGFDSQTPRCIKAETIYSRETIAQAHAFLEGHLFLSERAKDAIAAEAEKYDLENCLGVFARGTDYVALEPQYHPRQPSVEQLIEKIDMYLQKHEDSRIYLVTEDHNIFCKLKDYYGDRLIVTGDRFIEGYKGEGLVANCIEQANEQGLEYLIRVYLLARCRALIGGRAAGSNFATVLNGNQYEYRYIFELGHYREEGK